MILTRLRRRPAPWLLYACAALALSTTAASARGPLTLEERVACREKVEDVYWAHRLWPKENPGPKPPRELVLSHATILESVERSLRYETALQQVFGEALDTAAIQSEIDRQASSSRDPETLRELWAALDNDPDLIAECLVRPELAERRIRQRYADDADLHAATHRRAERELAGARTVDDLRSSGSRITETAWVGQAAKGSENGIAERVVVAPEEWRRLAADLSEGSRAPRIRTMGALHEDGERFYARSLVARARGQWRVTTVSWPKTPFAAWWQTTAARWSPALPPAGSYSLAPALGQACTDNSWRPVGNDAPRLSGSFTFWTGSEVLTWGGYNNRTGARYAPATDRWTPMSVVAAPPTPDQAVAVWTGSEMLVWGPNGGSGYSPAGDSWRALSATGAPSPRYHPTAVWTGSEMIIWGGRTADSVRLNSGARFNPTTGVWSATSLVNAATPRVGHTAVWTGNQMIVWGGSTFGPPGNDVFANDGAIYSPTTNSWSPMVVANQVGARGFHQAFWTGATMLVLGGLHFVSSPFPGAPPLYETWHDGWEFSPASGGWRALSMAGAPANLDGQAIWAANQLVYWPTDTDSGFRYKPTTDQWSRTSAAGRPLGDGLAWTGSAIYVLGHAERAGIRYDVASDSFQNIASAGDSPAERRGASAVWTGNEMIAWGGTGSDGWLLDSGGRYRPSTNTWLPTNTTGSPRGRTGHTAVWTGSEMIVWGGNRGSDTNDGGRYSPSSDTWSTTSTFTYPPEPRHGHTAVWTGTEMLVWGGTDGTTYFKTGGRYDPVYDLWAGINAGTGCPAGRTAHSGLWTGTQMIVWGGTNGTALNSGGRYDPATDLWTPTSLGTGVPTARSQHTAVWSGNEMIVWGGTLSGGRALADGARYALVSNTWNAIKPDPFGSSPLPALRQHVAVWTGSEMIVWGGNDGKSFTNIGARYKPSTGAWTATSTASVPLPRAESTAVWTGTEMIVWAGTSPYGELHSGGRYCASGATRGLAAPE